MPFYTFICEKCETAHNELVKMGTKEIDCKEEECDGKAIYSFAQSTRFASTGLPNGHHAIRSKTRLQ